MTGRNLSDELAAEIGKRVLRPFLAEYIGTPDPVAAWTGRGTIHFADREWTGVEGIAELGAVTEATGGSAQGASATLLRVPADLADAIAEQAVRHAPYERYFGALDETYRRVVGYKLIFRGTLQAFGIDDAGETLSVKVGGESRAIDQRRPAIKRFTDEYQMAKYEGDRFFEYAARMAEVPILWAKGSQQAI
jgi:hypothetical protein